MSECVYCGNGNRKKKNGLYRIHPQCLLEMQEYSQSIDSVIAFMNGYRPKNENDYPTVEAYLKGIHEFNERCKRIAAILSISKGEYTIAQWTFGEPEGRKDFGQITRTNRSKENHE